MTILSLSRFMLAGVLLASFNASAIPGFWQQGYGQGNTEYSVTEASGKTFTINCTGNPDQNGFYQHSVFLTLADDKMVSSHDDDTTITVVMDHQQYIIPSSLGWRNGDNAWFDFISNISEATSTSMTTKQGPSLRTGRTLRKFCPLSETAATTDSSIFPSKSTPTASRLPGFSFIRSPKMTQSVLLPPGPFTRRQAQAVTTTYSNITLEDDQGSHFRLVVRDTEGRMVWRAWNFEPDAGEGLNRYIRTSGIRTDTATR